MIDYFIDLFTKPAYQQSFADKLVFAVVFMVIIVLCCTLAYLGFVAIMKIAQKINKAQIKRYLDKCEKRRKKEDKEQK